MDKELSAINYFLENQDALMEQYLNVLRIPSVSTDPAHKKDMERTAEFLKDYFEKLGMDYIEIFPTKVHPIVFAEKKSALPDAKTLLIYGHYDVQPPDPLHEWNTPPFEPNKVGDYIYARGASDMKGQIMASIFALESILKTNDLPINVKFIIEGEEEIGSPSLVDFLEDHTELLKCDMILNPDAGMISATQPTIVYGLRGMVYIELRIDGPKMDLHSGLFGGNIANPANVIADIISKLHNPDGSVAIPGFYDKVRPLTPEERELIAMAGSLEDSYIKLTGVPRLYGEEGFTLLERQGARPTLDVNGLYSGYIEEGAKTIIPAYAKAKISCRLVPDQNPDDIYRLIKSYIASIVPNTVRAQIFKHSLGPAYLADDAPGYENLANALSETWGKPVTLKREGGSIPVATNMQEILGVKSLLTGFGLPDDAIHSPNERQHLPTWTKGVQALIRFLMSFAK